MTKYKINQPFIVDGKQSKVVEINISIKENSTKIAYLLRGTGKDYEYRKWFIESELG